MDEISPGIEELTSSVAFALNAWTGVEGTLAMLFYISSNIPNPRKAGAIFDSIVSFESRLAVCDAALTEDDRLTDGEKEIWAKLYDRLRKFYKKRHELAHFMITPPETDQPYGSRITPFFTWEKHRRKTTKYLKTGDIRLRMNRFTELREALLWLATTVGLRTPNGPAFEQPSEEPPLIVRIRVLLARCPQGSVPPG